MKCARRISAAWKRPLAAGAAVFAFAVSSIARADGSASRTFSLGWVRRPGAEACVAPRALAKAIEATLRKSVFVSAADADVSVEGEIERTPNGEWRAVLTVAGSDGAAIGSRELTATGPCSSMTDQVVLATALMIDPDAVLSAASSRAAPSAPRAAPSERPPIATSVPPRSEPSPPPRPERGQPLQAALSTGPAIAFGLTPSADIGLSVLGTVRPPRFWRVDLTGAVWADRNAEARPGAGATFSVAYAGAFLCPIGLASGRFDIAACAGAELGAIGMRGYGFAAAYAERRPLANGALDLRSGIRVAGPVAAGLDAGLLVPFLRDSFSYREAGGAEVELFRVAPVAFAAAITIGLAVP